MIRVCGLERLSRAIADAQPSHVVTLLEPSLAREVRTSLPKDRHFRLGVDDIDAPEYGRVVPESAHVERLIAFLRSWPAQRPIVIHCYMGVSRSMAAAFTLLTLLNPGEETRIAQHMRARAPHAQPNRAIISHADALLGRKGAMIHAVEAMGAGRMHSAGGVVRLSPDLEETTGAACD